MKFQYSRLDSALKIPFIQQQQTSPSPIWRRQRLTDLEFCKI